jgi:large subunit ribosomal protein L24e
MKCTFCGINIEKGTGKTYARNSGKLVYLCSSKCEKNMFKLGRKPRNISWTEEGSVKGEEAK